MFIKTQKQKEATKLLTSNAKRILLYGGSRSGKTLILLRALFIRALKKKSRHIIFRFRFNHAKASLWHDTIPKLIELEFKQVNIIANKQDWFFEFPNGSTIWIAGLDDKERTEKVLGNEYSTIYFNEISQINYESVLMALTRLAENSGLVNKVYFDCNPPASTHWAYKMFKKSIDPKTGLDLDNELYVSMLMNPVDNLENLPEGYIKETLDSLPDRQRRRFKYGEWVDDVEGALWNMAMIDKNRVSETPDLTRKVIAVDPAVTSNPDSDETGIIMGGKGIDGFGYILDDFSGKLTPRQWAERICYNYHKHQCDLVVGEVNNGGDLIESNIKIIDSNINFKAVHASRGKVIRAEPVVGLYEQNIIKHVGNHAGLEEQMTTWDAQSGDKSPDRVDANVWLLTELFLEKQTYSQWG